MISKPHPRKLFLLDAYALIFRAYYAFIRNPRINSKGLNTSAMFGMTNVLLDIMKNEQPSHLAVVFDAPAQTLREIDYEAYKANREETPEDIKLSVPFIMDIIRGFGIPILMKEGYEADDVVGTLAKIAEKEGFITYMMTSDKDYGQLVSENIFVYKPGYQGGPAEILGIPEVLQKFNIDRIDQVIDILGMMGDAVDNIPGIPGVGEKTAQKLCREFGSLEGLLENTHQLKGKLKENVEAYKDQAILSKKLATIILDAPVPFDESELVLKDWDKEKLKAIFDELEFKTLSKRILGEEPSEPVQGELFAVESLEATVVTEYKTILDVEHDYQLIDTEEGCRELVQKLSQHPHFCFDTETSDLDVFESRLVGLSFATQAQQAYYVHLPIEKEICQQWLGHFSSLFQDASKTLIGHNIKFDWKFMRSYGVVIQNKLYDTMIAHYLLHPDSKHGMDDVAQNLLHYTPISITELIGKKGKNQGSMADLSAEEIKDYACEDADITFQIFEKTSPQLEEQGLLSLFNDVEIPLIPILADMEWEGINIAVPFLQDYSAVLEHDLGQLEQQIFEIAGETFNLDSPKQLGPILFEKLKITDEIKKTKTGQYSTSEDVLSKYAHAHPIVNLILDYRELRKLKSTYVDAIPSLVHPKTHRLHTSFMQTVAATGRLSSNNPNIQNIPIRTIRGREIRKAFVPRDENHTILSADYSQIELRVIASLSEDKNMCEAFVSGKDIHQATAAKVFNVPLEEVTKEMRSKAKAVNFGIIYGQGAFGLAQNLGISRTEAKEIIDSYFKQFSTLKNFQADQIEMAKEKGFVETILHRKRHLADINSRNAIVRGFAERNAINAPIQGSAADIIKVAMIHIYQAFQREGVQSKMILQVHDELVFDVRKDEQEKVVSIVQDCMQNAVHLNVPLVAEYGVGDNWLVAH
ncbi:MAG: polymerase [Bacteroidota bacterium]